MATSTWVLDKVHNRIYNSAGTENVHNAFEPPYPSVYWYVATSPNNVTHGDFKEPQYMGAFMHCSNLSVALIPRSVKFIGQTAFRGTQLTSVTIARDCVYFSTSFPDGCVVNYYDD